MGTSINIEKKTVLIYALVNDLFTITCLVGLLCCLDWVQGDFAEKFDAQSVEMKDFSLRVDFLPEIYKVHKDEISMKFAIWKLI